MDNMQKKLRKRTSIRFASRDDPLRDAGLAAQQEIRDTPDAIEVDNWEGLPLCTHGHLIREKKEVRGRCRCDELLCERCPDLVCQRCGEILCRKCAFLDGDVVLCDRGHNFLVKLAASLASSSRQANAKKEA